MVTITQRRRPIATWLVQGLRVALFLAILATIHLHYAASLAREQSRGLNDLPVTTLQRVFPQAEGLGTVATDGRRVVLAADGATLGTVLQTFPEAARFLGFSGPTNLLVGEDDSGTIVGMAIISSRDTRDHVELIRNDPKFLSALNGQRTSEARPRQVDSVSGATLTSLAIQQGLQARLGGVVETSRFSEPIELTPVQDVFPNATALEDDPDLPGIKIVRDANGAQLGTLLVNSPAADQVVGYQGPTRAYVAIDNDGVIRRLVVSDSFDNEPYVGYLSQDYWFPELFTDKMLDELASMDWESAGIEGVSGATMTSQAVARGILLAADRVKQSQTQELKRENERESWRLRTATTVAILIAGLILAFTRWRSSRWARIPFQILLVVYLGFVNGDLLSMAMFAGWAQSGIPWSNALGLVCLSLAALVLPVLTRRNVYCDHLCPHGAAQQLLPRRLKWKRHPRWLIGVLRWIRPVLLVLAVLFALGILSGELVDLEPFDAYSWRAAAWPAMTIAIVGLFASLFLPMGYCQYGCPTGAILGYLRRNARSDRFTRADGFALGLLAISLVLLWKS